MAGCGRFFEGNPQLMHSALIEKLAKLPPTTVSSVPDIFTARTRSFREGNVFSPICLFTGGPCFQTCSFAPPRPFKLVHSGSPPPRQIGLRLKANTKYIL